MKVELLELGARARQSHKPDTVQRGRGCPMGRGLIDGIPDSVAGEIVMPDDLAC